MKYGNYTNLYEALKDLTAAKDVVKDTHGNVSQRTSATEMYIKPSGLPYEEISRQDLVRIHWESDFVKIDNSANGLNPSVDYLHHLEIYRKFSEVGGICHVHSPFVTSFAIVGQPITCATTEQADYFGGDVVCLPYSNFDTWGKDLVRAAFPYALQDGKNSGAGYLLRNHGAVVLGKSARHAVRLAVALENIAQKNFQAMTLEHMLKWKSPWIKFRPLARAEVQGWNERYETKYGQR